MKFNGWVELQMQAILNTYSKKLE